MVSPRDHAVRTAIRVRPHRGYGWIRKEGKRELLDAGAHRRNSSIFPVFLDQFAAAYPDSFNLLVLDQSGAHTAKQLIVPSNVRLVFLPPYSPELNPIERVWRAERPISVAAVPRHRDTAGVCA